METQNFKKTALYDEHVKRGGKNVEFGGFLLPVEYTGIENEHFAVKIMLVFLTFLTWERYLLLV